MNIRRIIKEELQKVMNPPSEVIDIDTEHGNIFGVIHHSREYVNNWASEERVQPNFNTFDDKELFPLGILKSINVDEEHRGQGYGSEMFDRFMVECSHCSYVVLIADTGEDNKFDLLDWYKSKGFTHWGESGGNPVMIKKIDSMNEEAIEEGHTTNDSNYEIEPNDISDKLVQLRNAGKSLDSNEEKNMEGIQVLSTGERSGRALAEVGYPDGTVVLFYKSSKGTSGKQQGAWYPIPGFLSRQLGRYPEGWFIKTSDIMQAYGSRVLMLTSHWLTMQENNLEEIDLSVHGSPRAKPGIVRQFPKEKEGGQSYNLSVSDGPHEFPKEEEM